MSAARLAEKYWNQPTIHQIYDYMNVNAIHNATFAKNLPAGYLEQARDLANFHEGNIFSSPQPNGIGNSKLIYQYVLRSCSDLTFS